jgi:hypothetical protein
MTKVVATAVLKANPTRVSYLPNAQTVLRNQVAWEILRKEAIAEVERAINRWLYSQEENEDVARDFG